MTTIAPICCVLQNMFFERVLQAQSLNQKQNLQFEWKVERKEASFNDLLEQKH